MYGRTHKEDRVIDFDAIIKTFGPKAVANLNQQKSKEADENAIKAIRNPTDAKSIRTLKDWLRSNSVFRGIDQEHREAITEAVLRWTGSVGSSSVLTNVNEICKAHTELMGLCEKANGNPRKFLSLASKAIWLCSPHDVPIYDQYAQNALFFLCKLDSEAPTISEDRTDYEQFVRVWKDKYVRHEKALSEVEMNGYPYRARVFDVILWIIGRPGYLVSKRW
jgi:hypothetical protein